MIVYKTDKPEPLKTITQNKIVKLKVPEPSGLHFNSDSNKLWTVSDETSKIYHLDFSGNIIKTLSVSGIDLEGITFINDTTIAVVLERSREVVFLNIFGEELFRFNIKLKGKPNSGLEGITYNSNEKILYLLNEKDPVLLIKSDLEGNIVFQKEINFAKDLSGLYYDRNKNKLWMVSDESNAIFKCNGEGELIKKYFTNINQMEGIAVNFKESELYIVSDKEESLYIFNLP